MPGLWGWGGALLARETAGAEPGAAAAAAAGGAGGDESSAQAALRREPDHRAETLHSSWAPGHLYPPLGHSLLICKMGPSQGCCEG